MELSRGLKRTMDQRHDVTGFDSSPHFETPKDDLSDKEVSALPAINKSCCVGIWQYECGQMISGDAFKDMIVTERAPVTAGTRDIPGRF